MANKKTPGVAFYGKVRIATIGHRKAIDQAKGIAKNTGGKLTIGLSGTSEPLTPALKKKHAEKVFGHPVMSGNEHTKTLSHFLTHMSRNHDDLHLVAGSDRAGEYRSFLEKYNGKKDRSGKTPFNFKSWKVHEVSGERTESNKDPRKMNRDELERSVSASKLEKLAKDGKYDHFKAYHPDMPDQHVRRLFTTIRAHHKLTESLQLQLSEELTRKDLAPMLSSFVSFASEKLGIKSMPSVRYKNDDDDYNSFAAYNPSSNELSISTLNRHPMDIFRSVAHELVHHKQNENGKLGHDIEKEGSTGSPIENEANSEAGKIMRWFAKANPDMFNKSYVVEDHAANHASSGDVRGMGYATGEVSPTVTSSYLLQNIKDTESMKKSNRTHILDTGDDNSWKDEEESEEYKKRNLQEGINDPGKLKAIFLAGGPGSGKDFVMNSVLQGEGLKEVNSDVAFEYLMKKNNLDLEMPDSERVERDIVRGRAKNITKEKERLALAGRLGLIINGTADDLEKIKTVKQKLEDDGYETMMVFVNTSNEVSRQRNVERGKSGNRKVPDGTDKQGVPDGSPDIRQEKWDLAQKNIGELQKIFGNKNFAVLDNTADMRKVTPEEKQVIQATFDRVRRMAQQFVRADNQNPAARKWISGEAQKRGITQYQEPKRYKTLTQIRKEVPQVVHKPDNEMMVQARRLGLSYYGFGRFGRKINGQNKVMYHSMGGKLVRVQMTEEKKMKNPCWKGFRAYGMKKKNGREVPNCVPVEEGRESIDMAKEYKKSNRLKKKVSRELAENLDNRFETFMEEHGAGDWGTKKLTKRYKKDTPGQKLAQEDNVLPRGGLPVSDGIGPTTTQYRPMTSVGYSLSESIENWMNSSKTQQKFAEKYGELADEKLLEAAIKLEQAGCGCSHSKGKKSMSQIKEGLGLGYNDMSPIAKQGKEEVEEDWQKINRKDGAGMSQKAVNAYRRENPGSKLKTAVTTKPSKLKAGSKSANRRKSFCARMSGMKKRLTSAKTARDPDSRINKALRKWNCEE